MRLEHRRRLVEHFVRRRGDHRATGRKLHLVDEREDLRLVGLSEDRRGLALFELVRLGGAFFVSDQIANPVEINEKNNNLWARAAFYAGIMGAYATTHDKKYLQQAFRWAEGRGWKLGERPRLAA